MIYRLVLMTEQNVGIEHTETGPKIDPEEIMYGNSVPRFITQWHAINTAILETSRQIYHEASTILYRENDLISFKNITLPPAVDGLALEHESVWTTDSRDLISDGSKSCSSAFKAQPHTMRRTKEMSAPPGGRKRNWIVEGGGLKLRRWRYFRLFSVCPHKLSKLSADALMWLVVFAKRGLTAQ